MSRAIVRQAIADWLNSVPIDGLDEVQPGKIQIQSPVIRADGNPYKGLAYVLLGVRNLNHEGRIALGGPYSGEKMIDYAATLVLHQWSAANDWIAAQLAFDDTIDAIKAQIRAGGRTLGRPDVILQAGEWTPGIDDYSTEPMLLNGGTLTVVTDLTFQVTEIITA